MQVHHPNYNTAAFESTPVLVLGLIRANNGRHGRTYLSEWRFSCQLIFREARGTQTAGQTVNIVAKILLTQLALGAAVAVVAGVMLGPVAAFSALLGTLICVIPNGFLALRMLVARRSGDPRRMLNATYVGEAGKIGLSIGMFAVVFVWVQPLHPLMLLTGFIVAQAGVGAAFLMSHETHLAN